MKKENLDYLKNKYPKGTLIHINWMEGEPQYIDREGFVEFVDDSGQIHGTWGGCALLNDEDDFCIVKK